MSEWEKIRNWSHSRKVAYAKAAATVRYADGRIEIYPTVKAVMARAAGTKPVQVKRAWYQHDGPLAPVVPARAWVGETILPVAPQSDAQ